MDPTTFQPFVTSTTPLELITSNDPTQEQSLLCSALHFVSAEPSPVSDSSDDLRRLHQFARRRDLKSSGSVPHVPEPAAPQALSSPQIPGTSSPDSQLSYALQIRGTPHPNPPEPRSPDPKPSLRRGGGEEGKALRGCTETPEARRPPTRPRLGLSPRLPSTAPLAQPCLYQRVGQHEPRTQHLLGKVSGGEGAPLV